MAVVPADLLHFVRHGEVHNPDRILYGRLENFGLSDRGHEMAERVANTLQVRPIVKIISSPLQRAVESAEPIPAAGRPHVDTYARFIEACRAFKL